MNIRIKLTIMFLLVGLIPVIAIGLLSFNIAKTELFNEINIGMIRLAEAKEGQVYAYLDSIESRTLDFSSDRFIKDLLDKINKGEDVNQTTDALNKYLIKNKQSLDETIAGIIILDLNGTVVASTNNEEMGADESSDDYFIKGKQEVFSIEVRGHEHFGLNNPFAVSAPLVNKETGDFQGVIVNIFDIDKLRSIISGEFQLERGAISGKRGQTETLKIYLINKEKKIFVHSPHLDKDGSVNEMTLVDSLPVQKCLENKEEITGIYKDYAGKEVIGASMCFTGREWTLITEIETEEAFLTLNRSSFMLGIIILVFLFFMIFFIFFISKRITQPILRLKDGADKIGRGNLDVKLDISSKDEIGELGKTFNKMAGDLKKYQEKLLQS